MQETFSIHKFSYMTFNFNTFSATGFSRKILQNSMYSPFLSKKKMWNYNFYGSGPYSGATKNFRRNLPKSPETHFMRYVLSFKNEKTVCFRRWAFKNRRNIIAFGARLFNSSLLFFKEKQIYRFNGVFFFPLHSVL